MCLIIHGPSHLIRSALLDTPHLIKEIYDQNSDGLGIMYNSTRGARMYKWLPRNAAEARAAVAAFPQDDRELAVHWRWRTHGAIDKDNCHPYPVDGGGYLMHNGVLETGNKEDTTRSDTYHYVKKFLSGGVMEHVAHDPAFNKLVTDHIGYGNKFVMMTSDGRMSVAGRHRGIELGGLWWSNTYAWDPRTFDSTWVDPDAKPARGYVVGDWVGNWRDQVAAYSDGTWHDDEEELDLSDLIEQWGLLLADCDVNGVAELIRENPYVELRALFDLEWETAAYSSDALDASSQKLLRMVLEADAAGLASACRAGNTLKVAETITYYTAWIIPDEDCPQPPSRLQVAVAESLEVPNAAYAG